MIGLELKREREVISEPLPDIRPPERSYLLPLLALLGITTLLHLVLALHYPVSEDETYYWDWSRNLDWGYYDQGPMIAWWMRGFCSILGETALGVRAGALVVTLGIQLCSFYMVRRLFGERAGFWSVLTLSVTPLAIVGGFVFTYDSLLILFWAAALSGLIQAHFKRSNWGWAVYGTALGLGLLSKLTMVLFLPCTVFFMLLAPGGSRHFRSPWLYLSTLLAFAIYVPNLIWQSAHDWSTFAHVRTLSKASQGKNAFGRMADLVGSQMAVITPVLMVILVVALVLAWKKRSDSRILFLWCFSAPVLILFFASTINGKVLANWTASGWYGACLLGGAWFASGYGSRRWSWWLHAGVGVSAAMSLAAVYPEVLAFIGIHLPEVVNRPSNRMFGGPELAVAVKDLQKTGSFKVAGTEYQQVSRLAFYLPGHPKVLCLFSSTRHNDYLFRQSDQSLSAGDNVILALETPIRKNEREAIETGFEHIDDVPTVVPVFRKPVHREAVRSYYLYRLYGFKPGTGGALLRPG